EPVVTAMVTARASPSQRPEPAEAVCVIHLGPRLGRLLSVLGPSDNLVGKESVNAQPAEIRGRCVSLGDRDRAWRRLGDRLDPDHAAGRWRRLGSCAFGDWG